MPANPIRPIRIEGNIAYVPLTQGYEAVIDAADVPLVEKWNWNANIKQTVVYARRNTTVAGKSINYLMHRLIIGAPRDMQVDHIDGDGLNNRRENLRLATNAQNQHNARIRKDNKTGFKGVTFWPVSGRWRAKIVFQNKPLFLGYFDTPEEAHAAYCEASERLHREFGRTS